jgi:hypothetical protein
MAEQFIQYYLDATQNANNAFVSNGDVNIAQSNLQSANYSPNTSAGWQLQQNGDVVFNNIVAKGKITATSGVIGGFDIGDTYLRDTGNSFGLSSSGTIRFWAGETLANIATAPFRLTATGVVTATSGTIGGWTLGATTLSTTGLVLDAGNKKITLGASNEITIDGTNKKIVSSNYQTGTSGFYIDSTLVEAENIIARGTLRGSTFAYDTVSAIGGQLRVSNADTLASDTTALDASTFTFKGDTTFAVNDILLARNNTGSGNVEEYIRVTNIASAPTYTVTRDIKGDFAPDSNPIWKAGTTFVKMGKSDGVSTYSGGWLNLIGEGTNAPYYSVFSRNGVAYNAYVEAMRMGNLNGFLGYSSDLFGIAIGDTTNYFKYDPTNGLRVSGDILNTKTLEAGQNLTANDWLVIGTDGKLYKADAGTSKQVNRVVGVCLATTSAGSQVPYQASDVTSAASSLTPSSIYYIQSPVNNISIAANGDYSGVYTTRRFAQTFTVGGSNVLCSGVHITVTKTNNPSDGVVSLFATTAGKPSGSALATYSLTSSDIIGTSDTELYVTWDIPITLSASTMYAIVLTGTGNLSNIYGWKGTSAGVSVYAGGTTYLSDDGGSTWIDQTKDSCLWVLTSAGTIGTTAGVTSKKIGLALSSAKLLIQNT